MTIIIAGLVTFAILWYAWCRITASRRLRQSIRHTVPHRNGGIGHLRGSPSISTPFRIPSAHTPSQPRRSSSTAPLSSLPTLSQIITLSRPTSCLGVSETERKSPETETDLECPICYEDMKGRVSVGSSFCGHQLCRTCRALIVSAAESKRTVARCHACRAPYD